jgi:hypothetical protein
MDTELRPLSLGEILDRTFQIYRSRFSLFAGIAVVAATIRLVFGGGFLALQEALRSGHQTTALQVTTALGSLVTAAVSWIAAGLTFAALTFAVEKIYLDRPTTITDAYQGVRLRLWRYVTLDLACFLLPFLPFVLIGLLAAVAMFAKAGSGNNVRAIAVVMGFAGVFFFISLPLCLWLASRYALANAAAISESLTVRAALKRSVSLSHGTRGRIILAMICIAFVQVCLGLLFIFPLFGPLSRSAGHPPLWISLYQLGFGFVSSVLFTPIYGIVLALFYYDSRIRKEGFDVEWLMERTERSQGFDSSAVGVLPT